MNDSRVRILFCTNGGLHGARVLRRLRASKDVQVVGVLRSSRLMRASFGYWRGAAAHLRLSGLAYLLYLWTSTSLADALLRFAGGAVTRMARDGSIPVHTSTNVNSSDAMAFASRLMPDLLVSAFFNQRIEEPLARLPRHGAINIHPSALPEFRGVDPVFFAYLRGSDHLGVSVHRIVSELDAGEIFRSEMSTVIAGESVFGATNRLFDRGGELLIEALPEIVAGVAGTPQRAGGNYDSWPTAAQAALLRKKGTHLVSTRDLANILRISSP